MTFPYPGSSKVAGKSRWWTLLFCLASTLVAHSGHTLTTLASSGPDFAACERTYKTPPDAECLRLSVAEDPDNPAGRHISLNILRVPAVTPAVDDPLFVIVGGPGGAAVRSAHQYLPYFRGLQQKRDIVFVDQRGTGESNPLQCPFDTVAFAQLDDAAKHRRGSEMAAACVADLDANLEFYTTPYAVQDLEQVRLALGYKQLNLWGVSYGTRVILEYLRRYPEAVRTSVLDGAAPVAIQLPKFLEQDAGRALELIFHQCAEEPACFETYGDLRAGWLALLERLKAQPETVVLSHPRSQEEIATYISPSVLSAWVRLTLYSRELAPLLPQAIQRAISHDFSMFGTISLLLTEEITEQLSAGMQTVVLCGEDFQYPAAAETDSVPDQVAIRSDTSLLPLADATVFAALCEHFPAGNVPPDYFMPVQSDVPTLLLSGEFDPVTPPHWGELVAQNLSNSHHLVVAGAHHGVTMQGCVPRLVRKFIEAGRVDAIDPECAQAIKPLPFFIDGAGPALIDEHTTVEAKE